MSDQPLLDYQLNSTSPVRRPRWVIAVVVIYLLLLMLFLLGPMILAMMSDVDDRVSIMFSVGSIVGLLVLAGLTLIMVPVRVMSRRPIRRGHIIWPIIGSGAMLGLLVLGGGVALMEWLRWTENPSVSFILIAAIITWIIWSIAIIAMTWSSDPSSFSNRLHQKIIVGSVLELLIAVPAHVVVRQRGECCAGIYTGAGICIGVAVLFVSLGPAVLLLYWRRIEKIQNH